MKPALITPDYAAFLAEVKGRIHSARLIAGRAVNRELVLLYWDIGRGIVEKQTVEGWGDAVVESLGRDLREEFPDMRGFSAVNLWRMRRFVAEHTAPEFLAQVAREASAPGSKPVPAILSQAVIELGKPTSTPMDARILSQAVRELVAAVPWGHHTNLLAGVADPTARLYYLRATAQFGWSRAVLLNQIKAQAFERAKAEKKTHNFAVALPEHFAEQADEMLKTDDVEVEFALKTKANPIGVAEYQLQAKLPAEFKGKLPTAKQLADVVRSVLPERKKK